MSKIDNKQFVVNAYNIILGREPDPAGLAGALYKLSIGMSRQDILRDFMGSGEFSTRLENVHNAPASIPSVMKKQDAPAIQHAILEAFDDNSIGLPPPAILEQSHVDAEKAMRTLVVELGSIADSDYFKTSRERFFHIVQLARELLPLGSRLLDIGNAPGYLAQALYHAGYVVAGINLSEAWNATYPDSDYLERFEVKACDIEKNPLPYADQSFEGIVFAEVLEHIAITAPEKLLQEFKRVLKPNGVVLFSTPNVCNLSNIIALATGKNVFWPTSMFYGSTDRHNREWTPAEVRQLFESAGFKIDFFYGMNDHANWRMGVSDQIYALLGKNPKPHALLRNTIVGAFKNV